MIIASTLLILFGLITKSINKVARDDIKRLLLLAFFQPFIYFIFEIESLKESSPTIIALIMAQIPLFAAIFNILVRRKKVPKNIFVGITISIVGVCLVMLCGDNASLMTTPYGVTMGMCAMLCAIAYMTLTKRLLEKYSPYTVMTYIHAIAFFYFLPFVLIFDIEQLMSINFSFDFIYPVLALGVLCSAVAFILMGYGIKNLGVIPSSLINNLSPGVTALGMYFMFNEHLTALQIVGILVSISGLTIGLKRVIR